jgi:hypothetical protein
MDGETIGIIVLICFFVGAISFLGYTLIHSTDSFNTLIGTKYMPELRERFTLVKPYDVIKDISLYNTYGSWYSGLLVLFDDDNGCSFNFNFRFNAVTKQIIPNFNCSYVKIDR